MKKRIIAILLAVSIFLFSFPHTEQRAYAEPVSIAVVAGTALIAAFSILVCATAAPGTSIDAYGGEFSGGGGSDTSIPFDKSKTYTILQGGIVDSSGDMVYRNNTAMLTQLGILAQSIQNSIDSGTTTIVNSKLDLSQAELEMILARSNTSIAALARPNINFNSGYNSTFLSLDLTKPFLLETLPVNSEFFLTRDGQSYSRIFFDDSRIVFSQYYVAFGRNADISVSGVTRFEPRLLKSDFRDYEVLQGGMTYGTGTLNDFYSSSNYAIGMPNLELLTLSRTFTSVNQYFSNPADSCFVYENGSITYMPISEVDTSGMTSGILSTTGNYGDFLKTIDSYSVGTDSLPAIDFPVDIPSDSTVSVPLDPDITKPVDDQIAVSVPNIGELTIADLRADVNTDIKVPSIIVEKFPFSIPFDFVRFLGILCSDPIAPVFRIPISTNPDNLDQWLGNQTIGDYIDPDSPPLFDIDEEIVIDLSVIPLVQPICYTCFIVGFVFLLLHITTKMIQH